MLFDLVEPNRTTIELVIPIRDMSLLLYDACDRN